LHFFVQVGHRKQHCASGGREEPLDHRRAPDKTRPTALKVSGKHNVQWFFHFTSQTLENGSSVARHTRKARFFKVIGCNEAMSSEGESRAATTADATAGHVGITTSESAIVVAAKQSAGEADGHADKRRGVDSGMLVVLLKKSLRWFFSCGMTANMHSIWTHLRKQKSEKTNFFFFFFFFLCRQVASSRCLCRLTMIRS
jgi:hypothetical protein